MEENQDGNDDAGLFSQDERTEFSEEWEELLGQLQDAECHGLQQPE